MPPKFRDAPTLLPGMELYFAAWLDLQGDRGGMGDGRIPWSVVVQYGTYYGFDREQIDDLHYHVRAMDDVWLQHQDRERKKK